MAPFEFLFFESLDAEQTVMIEEMPRWVATTPIDVGSIPEPAFVCFRVDEGDDRDQVHADVFKWLHGCGLPAGQRVTIAD